MAKKRTGEVYWAKSPKIDKEDRKPRRQYVVVRDSGKSVAVSKIRGCNDNKKNDERLHELSMNKYPLKKKSGVDVQVYKKRADTGKPLMHEDRDVFDAEKSFKLSSHDTYRVLQHIGVGMRSKNKKGRKR